MGGRGAHFGGAAREEARTSTALPSKGDACRLPRLRRMLSGMSDPFARLNAALEGRYAIERELGEGGDGHGLPGRRPSRRLARVVAPYARNRWRSPVPAAAGNTTSPSSSRADDPLYVRPPSRA